MLVEDCITIKWWCSIYFSSILFFIVIRMYYLSPHETDIIPHFSPNFPPFYSLLSSKCITLAPMKQTILLISALFLLSGCGSKTSHPQSSDEPVATTTDSVITADVTGDTSSEPSSDEVVQNAIAKFLKGDKGAVRFTERAKRDLYESTWPEAQCSVEGMLDSPASFKDLVVKKVGPSLYKYEAVCPDHGDRYVDCCTMSAHVAQDGVVEIDGVKWDDVKSESFADLLSTVTWHDTEYGFRFPGCMTPSSEIWVDEVPGSLYRWNYEDVCLACWPLLGAWAVTDYPDTDSYLTEDVHVKSITYRSGDDSVFSGYATDGRIWYMKKKLTKGGEVTHAKILVLLYPKAMQSDVTKLIEVVKGW